MTFSPLDPFLLLPFITLLGLIFGSFITALSYRLPRGLNAAHGRSRCFACGVALGVRDLVPVFSWLAARGVCRHCGARISGRYPVIEAATAALFLAAALVIEDLGRLTIVVFITVVSVTLAVIDIEHRKLPNSLVASLAVGAIVWRALGDGDFLTAAVSAAAVGGIGAVLAWLTRKISSDRLGTGDVKLMGVIALAFPPFELSVVLIAAGLGGLAVGFVYRAVRRSSPAVFPFGPPLLAAFWVGLLTV